MDSCIEALRQYFDARSRVWLTRDAESFAALKGAAANEPWVKRSVHLAERKHRAYQAQGKQLLRVHTQIEIRELVQGKEPNLVHARATERLCWTYEDRRNVVEVECRTIEHRQLWQRAGHTWRLVQAEETTDGKSFDSFPETRGNYVLPRLPRDRNRRQDVYDRVRATRYADVWWDSTNPRYPRLEDDCTNFISQCLHAGGIPMWGQPDVSGGWWIDTNDPQTGRWSYSWTTSNALFRIVTSALGGQIVATASDLKMGDLIFYDWTGSGAYHHTTIVTEFDAAGEPLVNAHTDDSFHRPYLYYDSRAYTPNTRYAFVHLPDQVTLVKQS
ncbi:putative amidase-like protein [Alicyclobacillus sacchari]|uniref:Putative amidase-like protein n=1 Tax=Alicyclobacillus sacchari TaxID=392010 RepID=A0A4R8LKB4_9BACL|nr:amidase domain-containing protein [Alicyclobacillus sacchari]TDY44550.1 putative amidase-like protein [Alicyclobacillus sacchari]